MLSFHALGSWDDRSVTAREIASLRVIHVEVEKQILEAWDRARADRPEVNLFDGPMCRLENFVADDRQLQLNVSRTSYRVFFGTNLSHPELADRFGAQVLANSVGMSAGVVSADNQLLLGRRNMKVAYYPGRIHPFGGSLEPQETLDVFAEMRRELYEELKLASDDLVELCCLGIAEDRSIRQPELIFLAAGKLSRHDIEKCLDTQEHIACWSAPMDAARLSEVLTSDEPLTPIARATIMLLGRQRFGHDWFKAAAADNMTA